jgi:hypothetical protein
VVDTAKTRSPVNTLPPSIKEAPPGFIPWVEEGRQMVGSLKASTSIRIASSGVAFLGISGIGHGRLARAASSADSHSRHRKAWPVGVQPCFRSSGRRCDGQRVIRRLYQVSVWPTDEP